KPGESMSTDSIGLEARSLDPSRVAFICGVGFEILPDMPERVKLVAAYLVGPKWPFEIIWSTILDPFYLRSPEQPLAIRTVLDDLRNNLGPALRRFTDLVDPPP